MRIDKTFSFVFGLTAVVWIFIAIDQRSALSNKELAPSAQTVRQELVYPNAERWIEEKFTQMLADAKNPAVNIQIDEVNRQIEELEKMKRGFEARARRHEDQAQRLQFEDRAVLETRRHNELAEENRLKAERVQQEIDRLKEEREKLLKNTA